MPYDVPTDSLSNLLASALVDARAFDKLVDQDPSHFSWRMSTWIYRWSVANKRGCSACMAGAVMYMHDLPARNEDDNTPLWARAVDKMRIGRLWGAALDLFGSEYVALNEWKLVATQTYFDELLDNNVEETPPSGFLTWVQYDQIVAKLRSYGL